MTVSPVGREVARVDGRLKVTGAARYSGDYPATNMSYAHVVTSTVARGTIRSIDTAAALAAPGVLRVYVAGDRRLRLYPLAPEFSFFGENYIPLQDTTVRYYGQIIAMVVAESVEQARDAAAQITVTYDAQPPRSSLADGPREPSDPTSSGEPSSVTVLAPASSRLTRRSPPAKSSWRPTSSSRCNTTSRWNPTPSSPSGTVTG